MPGEAVEVAGPSSGVRLGGGAVGRTGRRSVCRALRSVAVLLGAGFAGLVVAMALFANVVAPTAPDEQSFDLIVYGWLEPRIRFG